VRPAAAPAEHRDLSLDLVLYAGPRWLTGALPDSTFGGAIGATLSAHPTLAVDVSALFAGVVSSELAGNRASAWLAGGQALGCAQLELGRATVQGCLGASAAACRVDSAQSRSDTLLWSSAQMRAALHWPNDAVVSVRLFAQGHLNLVRPGLRVDGRSERLTPAWLGATLGIDLLFALFR
jgi:hypothetical protein